MLRGNLHDATHFFGGARIDDGRTTAMPEAYVFRAVDDCSLISDDVTFADDFPDFCDRVRQISFHLLSVLP